MIEDIGQGPFAVVVEVGGGVVFVDGGGDGEADAQLDRILGDDADAFLLGG